MMDRKMQNGATRMSLPYPLIFTAGLAMIPATAWSHSRLTRFTSYEIASVAPCPTRRHHDYVRYLNERLRISTRIGFRQEKKKVGGWGRGG